MVKKISDETRLPEEVVRDLTCDDPAARKKALDALMVFAWLPGWDPGELIALGGIPPLIGRLGEEDEKMRHHAVEILDRLAVLGASRELAEAGALPPLERIASADRYEPLRMVAGRTAARIRGQK